MDRQPTPTRSTVVARTATKPIESTLVGDLAELGTELKDELVEVGGELADLGAELRHDVADLGREVRAEAAGLRRELKSVVAEVLDAKQRRRLGVLLVNLAIGLGVAAAVLLAILA